MTEARARKGSLTYMQPGQSLSSAPLDTPLTLVAISAKPDHARRLSTLGIRKGSQVRLLTRTIGGGRIALVAGSRIALGSDLVRLLRAEVA